MDEQQELTLYEEVMLLALRDEEGTIASGALYTYAIGGAILAELLLQGRVTVEEHRKKKYIKVVDPAPVGDPLLDECLAKIASAKRRGTAATWVTRFASIKNLKHRVAKQLCDRGILRADEQSFLLIFTRRVYPEINPIPEDELRARLRAAIETDTDEIDPRTIVLISLAYRTGLLRTIYPKKDLKRHARRIEQIANGEVTGKAAQEAIAAVQAAVLVAVIVPTIAAAAASNH